MTEGGSTVGVIGLGSMGFGMARSLVRAGHRTHGFDVVPEQEARFRSEGGAAGSLAAVAPSLDALVVVVLNAAQTEFGALRPGGRCPVSPPRRGRDLLRDGGARLCPRDGGALRRRRAPLPRRPDLRRGGPAAEGKLSVMAAGTPEAFAAAEPVLAATAETVFRLGDAAGAGSAMKAVNQLLAGVHIAAMAEALTFGITQGVTPEQFLAVISKCAGTSWMLENRAPHIIDGDYTPRSSVDIWPKDLGIVLEIAGRAKFSAPIAAAALQQFLAASGSGLGREDDAAVAKVYARNAGLKLPGEG